MGLKVKELQAALIKAPADVSFGDVVSAMGHASFDPGQVVLRRGQSDVPDVDLKALAGRLFEQFGKAAATQRGLEVVIQPLCNGLLQQLFAFVPGCTVGLGVAQVRVRRADGRSRFVWVEIVAAARTDGGAADAAFACAIGTDDGDHLAGIDLQRDAFNGLNGTIRKFN